jgi:hypothetical protein
MKILTFNAAISASMYMAITVGNLQKSDGRANLEKSHGRAGYRNAFFAWRMIELYIFTVANAETYVTESKNAADEKISPNRYRGAVLCHTCQRNPN